MEFHPGSGHRPRPGRCGAREGARSAARLRPAEKSSRKMFPSRAQRRRDSQLLSEAASRGGDGGGGEGVAAAVDVDARPRPPASKRNATSRAATSRTFDAPPLPAATTTTFSERTASRGKSGRKIEKRDDSSDRQRGRHCEYLFCLRLSSDSPLVFFCPGREDRGGGSAAVATAVAK